MLKTVDCSGQLKNLESQRHTTSRIPDANAMELNDVSHWQYEVARAERIGQV